jgi:hypothetical protein
MYFEMQLLSGMPKIILPVKIYYLLVVWSDSHIYFTETAPTNPADYSPFIVNQVDSHFLLYP